MSKCDHCHENIAVIFSGQAGQGQQSYKGYCLSCAYRYPELGMRSMLEAAGLREEQLEAVNEHVNQAFEGMSDEEAGEAIQRVEELMQQFPMEEMRSALEKAQNGELDFTSMQEEMSEAMQGQNVSDFLEELNAKGLAITGETQVGEALKQVFSGLFGEEGEQLLPAARGVDSLGEEASETNTGHQSTQSHVKKKMKKKHLELYGTNLTEKARQKQLDPIVGREKELQRVLQILNRRVKNNPVLLGEPGVGKTAIAEGLAQRIAEGQVPAKLLEMEVYLIDMTALLAGTQFRGQFEARMKGLVDEASAQGNVILVIDELHNIMGAGDAEGAMNAANILKPSLARAEIRVLGSTTLSEYRRFIEKDTALERRFQQVLVEEPDQAATLEILRGVRPVLEQHHHVLITDERLKEAYRLADRYVSGRFFPDKAIDILDEAASSVNLNDHQLLESARLRQSIEETKLELSEAEAPLDAEAEAKHFEQQAKTKSKLLKLEADLQELEKELRPVPLRFEDLAQVVELWTGIPAKQVTEVDRDKLLALEARLHERVIGQHQAVEALARAIRRSRSGLVSRKKPSSFVFVGPTGVGKTELVKALSAVLFDREDQLIRLDMSEYMEPHSVSKLIGSPPGYVGYDEAGQLTEKVRRQPYSVILLDEIEKAHADVYNLLLQVLDEGHLTDSHGRVVDFAHCVLIMTSNAGTTAKASTYGFGRESKVDREAQVQEALKKIFRPEFLNRLDEVIVFDRLSQEDLKQILALMLKETKQALEQRGIRLILTEACEVELTQEGYSETYGARPLRRVIQRRIEDPLADLLLAGGLEGKIGVSLDYRDGQYQMEML